MFFLHRPLRLIHFLAFLWFPILFGTKGTVTLNRYIVLIIALFRQDLRLMTVRYFPSVFIHKHSLVFGNRLILSLVVDLFEKMVLFVAPRAGLVRSATLKGFVIHA